MGILIKRVSTCASKIANTGKDLIILALMVNIVDDYLSGNALKELEEEATKAGYNDVDNYIRSHAIRYQECVAEKGVENSICKAYKSYWWKCKKAKYGFKLAGNKVVHKMLEEDATKAGYKNGYNSKNDGKSLEAIDAYAECAATYGAHPKCKKLLMYMLESKAGQNGIGGFTGEK